MLFSLYYGVDLTKGFLSVALALMDASIQDLQRLPEMVLDAPMALPASESASNPLDPSVLHLSLHHWMMVRERAHHVCGDLGIFF